MKSTYNFLASTSPGLQNYLVQELKQFGIYAKYYRQINETVFRCSFAKFFQVLHYSKYCETLKIQVAHPFLARGEKEMDDSLKKLPWHAFLPIKTLDQFAPPNVKVKSCSRYFVQTSHIQQSVTKTINLMPIRWEYKEMKKLGYTGNVQLIEQKIKEKQRRIAELQERNALLIKMQEAKKSGENEVPLLLPKRELPQIYVHLYRNRLRASIVLANELYKYGFKQRVNWGPLRENIIAAIISKIQILQRAKGAQRLKVWDPFCGSGSIIITLAQILLDLPIRQSVSIDYLNFFPIFPRADYEQFLLEMRSGQEVQQKEALLQKFKEIQIIGSDHQPQSVSYCLENIRNTKIEEILSRFATDPECGGGTKQYINRVPHLSKFSLAKGNLHVICSDFESALENPEGFTIITNLPFGVRSSDLYQQRTLRQTFARFSKYIKKNLKLLDEVYVIYIIKPKYNENDFMWQSKCVWHLLEGYNVGGINIGLFQLDKEKSRRSEKFELISRTHENEYLPTQTSYVVQDNRIKLIKGQPRDVASIVPAAEQHALNKKKMVADYKQKFEKSKFLIEAIKNRIGKRFLKLYSKTKVRQIIHNRRVEWVKRQQLNDLLKNKSEKEKAVIDRIERKFASKRNRVNRQFLKAAVNLSNLESADRESAIEKIQEKLDTSAHKKLMKEEQFKKKRENQKKIASW